MNRREFLEGLAVAALAGLPVARATAQDLAKGASFYDGAIKPFGNVSLLHFTDCHAQLLPIYFREPNVNLGVGPAAGQPPHLVGEALLKHFGIAPGTRDAHAFTYLDFTKAAQSVRRDGRLRAPRHAGERAACHASRRAAARRRRHVARLGDVALDEGAGHGRRAEAPGRRRDDRPLGVHLRRRPREGSGRARLRRQGRLRRAEREDRPTSAIRCSSPTSSSRSTACRWRSSGRRFRTRRSPIRATSCPSGRSASRTRRCRRSSTTRAPRARRSSSCCRTTAWTSTSRWRRA